MHTRTALYLEPDPKADFLAALRRVEEADRHILGAAMSLYTLLEHSFMAVQHIANTHYSSRTLPDPETWFDVKPGPEAVCVGVQDYLPPAMHEAFLAITTEFVLLPWRHAMRSALEGASQGGSQVSPS